MNVYVWNADCLAALKQLDDESIDAICTDPPYGLEFMGKDWDSFQPGGKQPTFGKADNTPFRRYTGTASWGATGNPNCLNCGGDKYRNGPRRCQCEKPDFGNHMANQMRAFQQWCEQWATECLRVLKPGGHLLAFGGTRTYHRLACAIEDAGFEIRDSVMWVYGSGFPKSHDVSKAIDKAAGAEREVVGTQSAGASSLQRVSRVEQGYRDNLTSCTPEAIPVTAPSTDSAQQWEGWGTALKPSTEPIIVARKPLIGTVAKNVQQHGTGALNIDGCRVGTTRQVPASHSQTPNKIYGVFPPGEGRSKTELDPNMGRWPPNLVFSHSDCTDDECSEDCAVAELDRQSGDRPTGDVKPYTRQNREGFTGPMPTEVSFNRKGDSGGASRFFPCFKYQSKAPAKERPKVDGISHSTVKPLTLMRWLVRLVTPPGGIVLDPFVGSGTTLEAAYLEGFLSVGIENYADYIKLIEARFEKHPDATLKMINDNDTE